MRRSLQFTNAVDRDRWSTGAFNFCAHLDQQFRKICDFGFASGIIQDGSTLSEDRSHHEVLGSGDSDLVESDLSSRQPIARRFHITVFHLYLGSKLFEALQVEVDGPRPDGA